MLLENLLDQPLTGWMNGEGPDGDIVISSRIRLARNLEGVPFPNRAEKQQLSGVVDQLVTSLDDLAQSGGEYLLVELERLSMFDRNILVEKHIASPNLVAQPLNRALLINNDTSVSIMVNEEDHLRIQSMTAGLNLTVALGAANQADDAIEKKHDIAFSEQLGYLTACPTNLGTGLRASVMIHLPALVLTKQIGRIFDAVTQLGLAVRGMYGEGTEAIGNIFQISNQLTLGHSEQEIIENLHSVVTQVVGRERASREMLFEHSQDSIADRIWRSYGVLRYARSISGQEALAKLSEVRLGIDLGIISEVSPQTFNELLVTTRPNFLQRIAGGIDIKPVERARLRAQTIREKLNDEIGDER